MPVIRPTIPASLIIVRCADESIRTDSFREANAFLLRRGASQTDKTISFIVTWKDGRVAKDTVVLYPGITLGNLLSAVWHRPADMTDDQYNAFIREKTSCKRSSGWPLSTLLREAPRYDVGVGQDLTDDAIIASQQQGDKPESTREHQLRTLLFRFTTQALGTFDVDEAMQDIFGILGVDSDSPDDLVGEHDDEAGITSFEAVITTLPLEDDGGVPLRIMMPRQLFIMDPFVKTLGRGTLRWRPLLSPAGWRDCVSRCWRVG